MLRSVTTQCVSVCGCVCVCGCVGVCVCVCVWVCVCENILKQSQTFNSFIKCFNTQLRPIIFYQIAFSHSNTSPGLVSRFRETAMKTKTPY